MFEMELVRQVEVNIDYILMLVERYHSKHCKDKNVLASIKLMVDASPQLRSKKKLIEGFIAQLNEKELRELAYYSNGAAAIARAEKKSRIVESMRNLFNEFVGLIGFSQYDSQKD